MLDFLLKNQPEFLKKFREYSKECFVFVDAVIDHMMKENITKTPLSDEINASYSFDNKYGGNDFKVIFSDNLNFILAKNKMIETDATSKAYILIDNIVGSTRMNFHLVDYKDNPFPIDFTVVGLGSVEHFFLNEDNSKIHEIKFGTWRFPNEKELADNKILNIFPSILQEDLPSIEIKFSQENEIIMIDFTYNAGIVEGAESDKESFNICFKLDKKKSKFSISAHKDPHELRMYMIENFKDATQKLVFDSISEWLSQSIKLEDILAKADSDQIEVTYGIFSQKNAKIHPTEQELQKIEECEEGESRITSRPRNLESRVPSQKTSNPHFKKVDSDNWWIKTAKRS